MAVEDIPRPRSYPQILGEMIDTVTFKLGISRLKPGAPALSALEAAARSDVRNSQNIFNLLRSIDINNAEGIALDRIGADENIRRIRLRKATGLVTISDTSFTKVSSKVYSGSAAPIVGSVAIKVEDASDAAGFPASGSIYIGRQSSNLEGPLDYASKTNNGSFWTLNLSSPTSKFHNQGEEVVLSQGGNRLIEKGQIVGTPQGALASAVRFSTIYKATIPDGETEVVGVSVAATTAGAQGNVEASTVTNFISGLPFPGAAVNNPSPYQTGRDTESDNDYRQRIKDVRNSRQAGTDLAIKNAVLDISSPDDSKRVSSTALVRTHGAAHRLYIDDGTGLEEETSGVGIETIVDKAMGGEFQFQFLKRPVSKAFLTTKNTAPFVLSSGSKLAIRVGGDLSVHTFDATQFTSIEAAGAFEVVASINSNPDISFSARTHKNGTAVTVFSRTEKNEDIVIDDVGASETDANDALKFPVSPSFTTLLYQNDILLFKDGRKAVLKSNAFSSWNQFTGTQTLELSIDGTPTSTYYFTDQDFIDNTTDFSATGKNSLEAWAAVLNAGIPGITVVVEEDRLSITSNRGPSSKAALSVVGGTLVTNFIINTGSDTGIDKDYTLDRGTGQVILEKHLAKDDRLSAGTKWTRAFLETPSIGITNVADEANIWFVIDGDPEIIKQGIGSATPLTASVEAVMDHSFHIGIFANAVSDVFSNVSRGDWVVLYDPDTDLPDVLRNAFRVLDVVEVSELQNKIIIEKPAARVPRVGFASTTISATTPSKVIVTGGFTQDDGPGVVATFNPGTRSGRGVTDTTEILDPDPSSGTWIFGASMLSRRALHTATELGDGRILVTGGVDAGGNILDSTEIYDPSTDTWTAGPDMANPRANHSATVLPSGRVLIVGGWNGSAANNDSQEFDDTTDTFINAAVKSFAQFAHESVALKTSTAVLGDQIICAGGYTAVATKTAQVDLYDPSAFSWSTIASMSSARANFGAGLFKDASGSHDSVIVMGDGEDGSGEEATYEIFDTNTSAWGGAQTLPSSFKWRDKRLTDNDIFYGRSLYALFGVEEIGVTRAVRHYKIEHNDTSTATFIQLTDSIWKGGVCKVGSQSMVVKAFGNHEGGDGADTICVVGGTNRQNLQPSQPAAGRTIATHEVLDVDPVGATYIWTQPDPSLALNNDTLGARGVVVIRTDNYLQKATIPANPSYTAPTFVDEINDDLIGATASVYRTNKLRLQTNSFDKTRDIVLAASDISGPAALLPDLLKLPVGVVKKNVVGHLGSVEAGNPDIGTPSFFQVYNASHSQDGHVQDANESVLITEPIGTTPPPTAGTFLGLQRWDDGINPEYWSSGFFANDPTTELRIDEIGNNMPFRSSIAAYSDADSSVSDQNDYALIGLRKEPFNTIAPHQPVVIGVPYSIGPNDTIAAVIDQDTALKRFVVPMFRRLKPTSTTYGVQNAMADADNSNGTLSSAFGVDYDFDDFAIMMRARAKSHNSDSTKRTLWRFYRHGPEGNNVVVRHTYPAAPNSDIAVDVIQTQNNDSTEKGIITDLAGRPVISSHIVLGSGAARDASTIRATSRLGLARTNGSSTTGIYDHYMILGYNVAEHQRVAADGITGNRLLIDIPDNPGTGPTATGISAGDVLWFEADNPDPTILYSGSFTVTATDAVSGGQQNIYFDVNSLGDGLDSGPNANPGTASLDTSGEAFWDPDTAVNDLVRITDIAAGYNDTTMRITAVGRQYIRARGLDYSTAGAVSVPVDTQIDDPSRISVFEGPTSTAQEIADAVDTLVSESNSKVPITATIIGTGGGVVDQATWDELDLATAHYRLADGVNYVQRTVDPPDTLTHTEFLFRNPITAELVSDSDWANEDVRLVPILTKNIVDWMSAPPVSGLFTSAEVRASDDGRRPQIATSTPGSEGAVEIQGGGANTATAAVSGTALLVDRDEHDTMLVTTTAAEASALVGGSWVIVDNTLTQAKGSFWGSGDNVVSIDASGKWTLDVLPYTVLSEIDNLRVVVEKVGKLVALHFPWSLNHEIPSTSDAAEQNFVYVKTPDLKESLLDDIADTNTGVFRIVRSSTSHFGVTVWIENSGAINQVAVCEVKLLSSDSVVPGDIWSVSTSKFGAANRKTWKVTEVGSSSPGEEQYDGSMVIHVDVSETPTAALTVSTTFGTDAELVQLREGVANRLWKRVVSVVPNQTDGTKADIQLESHIGFSAVSASTGSVLSAADKLDFPTGTFVGVDGYRNHTGLIQEANRVLYGDPSDPATYPGVAASGRNILVSGPLVKRIKVALSLRVQSGLANDDLADRVRSSVASTINQSPIGHPISISDIVAAAAEVGGVTAVSVSKPVFTSTNDIIEVDSREKALVLDLNDISITFLGE